MTGSKPKIRVAIIGAGIAGLALSVALKQMDKLDNIQVDIYETAPVLSEIGAGINLWYRTWEILKNIGLEDTLFEMMPAASNRVNELQLIFEVRKSDQQHGVAIRDLTMTSGPLRIHRADLQRALLKRSKGTLHLSSRLVSYTELNKSVQLEFEDGVTEMCDIVIGADGIKSTMRKRFLRNLYPGLGGPTSVGDPFWTGSVAYRGLVTAEAIEEKYPGHRAITKPVMYCGKHKHLIVYPLPDAGLTNVVAFVTDTSREGNVWAGSDSTKISQHEVFRHYVNWEDEVQALLQCIEDPTRWAIFDLMPLEKFSCRRVILMGDAAHAMTPHQGAGAGQAIEDAYILATLLTNEACNPTTLPLVGEVYDAIRRPFANDVLLSSRAHGKCSQFDAPGFENIKEGDDIPIEKLQTLFLDLSKSWEWVCSTSAEDDRERALQMLADASR